MTTNGRRPVYGNSATRPGAPGVRWVPRRAAPMEEEDQAASPLAPVPSPVPAPPPQLSGAAKIARLGLRAAPPGGPVCPTHGQGSMWTQFRGAWGWIVQCIDCSWTPEQEGPAPRRGFLRPGAAVRGPNQTWAPIYAALTWGPATVASAAGACGLSPSVVQGVMTRGVRGGYLTRSAERVFVPPSYMAYTFTLTDKGMERVRWAIQVGLLRTADDGGAA